MLKVIVLLSVVALSYALSHAFEKVDPTDEDVVRAANEAAKALSLKFSGKFHHRLARIITAKKSDQGPDTYILNIIVGQTTCTKYESTYEDIDGCDFETGISAYKKCTVVVFKYAKGDLKMMGSGCVLATSDEVEGIDEE